MKTRILLLATLLILLLAACGTNQGAAGSGSASEYGYLNLSGSMKNREAWVAGVQMGIDPEADNHRVRLTIGIHKLEFRSANRILRADEILIEAGKTLEIPMP